MVVYYHRTSRSLFSEPVKKNVGGGIKMYKRKTVDCYAIEGFTKGMAGTLNVIVKIIRMQRYS